MSQETVEILKKHILKYFKLAPDYFAEGTDKEKLADWIAKRLMTDGWMRVTPAITRETLHPLHLDGKFLGAKVGKNTVEVLPKNSKIAIIEKGPEHPLSQAHEIPNFEGM